ncbi:hypothetical protein D3C80_1549340 [compost metagenome]
MQPQRDLRQFDGHRVLVHAIDAAFQHHATDDVPVVQLLLVDRPLRGPGVLQDRGANVLDLVGQRRDVADVHAQSGDLRHGVEDVVGQGVDQADKEVSRTHGRIADA